MKVKMTRGKFEGINACADKRGVIAALAVDHRGNLLQEVARSRSEKGTASAADMLTFKTAVTKTLTPYASAILLDPEYGLGAISSRSPSMGPKPSKFSCTTIHSMMLTSTCSNTSILNASAQNVWHWMCRFF